MYYTYIKTPVGKLLVAGTKDTIKLISFPKDKKIYIQKPQWQENPEIFQQACCQIQDYFAGRLKQFSLKIEVNGTQFQKKVFKALEKVPYGTTISYGGLAKKIGSPKASRAVGAANARNPVPIIIPCHRVIGSNGNLVGFGGGLEVKKFLLDLEQRYL